ncbi:NlpC/P60 family protein [Vibrio mytili]|uniref:C40 family peptidase n=1 Tax=Vibrio mytili TaxID=50718 RepID=UPI003C6EEAA9
MGILRRIYLSLIICGLVTACSSAPKPNEDTTDVVSNHQAASSHHTTKNHKQTLANNPDLLRFYNEWHGTPYRWGGTKKSGIDCSAFVQKAFVKAYQLSLPRTTRQQSKQGVKLSWEEAQYGDLVFFKTTRTNYHVGIYIGNKQFMHVSTSKGVMISRTDNPYWASKFWQIRRVTL